jgi:hypothetical protein
MSSHKTKDYEAFARDCVNLANQANTPALRQRLMDMAREWMRASMEEQDALASVAQGKGKSRYGNHGQADGNDRQ